MSALDYAVEATPADGCICATLSARAGVGLPALSERITDRTLDIANRLRFVCAHLPPAELLQLATQMAVIEVKYACGGLPHAAPTQS